MDGASYATSSSLWGTAVPKIGNAAAFRSRFGDVMLVVFLVTQCLDGLFTYIGVHELGLGMEANPLIAGLIGHFGAAGALLGAKIVACVLGMALHLRQVHSAVALLAAFYLAVAILPWAAILYL